jgi:hypothetical protein
MIKLSCLCGAVHVETAKRPDYIHECNCTLCTKTGARWGYFHPSEVVVSGETHSYCRRDKAEAAAQVQFCPICGSTTHFTLTESVAAKLGDVMAGVNLRLADESDLTGIELRCPDGRAWAGSGEFSYVREANILGGDPRAG